ncbi:MAG TPA: sulfotransferase, partial [Acetobacteraceae bacterium]|nr:sulfotransferase [Acetobacteraceae bacterium]
GDPDRAETLIQEARATAPGAAAPEDRMLGLLRNLLLLRRGDARGALERIEAVEREIAPQPLAASEAAAKGQALERLGRPGEAFAAYRAGREYQHRLGRRFHPAPLEARATALREAFMAEKLAALPRPPPVPHPMPVFLLGVQRSGTSLLEQLLSQAPGIDPADGRAPLDDLTRLLPKLAAGLGGPDLPYPAALAGLAAGEARAVLPMLAERYLALLRERGVITGETRFVTDRSPGLPWTLGLAALLFPAAPVIHLLRHPLDVVLSGFAQDRLYEGGAGVTLESLARLYDIQMSMIGHFRGQMTLRYLPVRYEELVADPQATLRRVLDFIGIRADPAGLLAAPPRPVPRAPEHQALREPPHRRGLYRHRAFGPVLAEAMPPLEPWLERLGYRGAAREAA